MKLLLTSRKPDPLLMKLRALKIEIRFKVSGLRRLFSQDLRMQIKGLICGIELDTIKKHSSETSG